MKAKVYKLNEKEIAREKEVYVGLDEHKLTWDITVMDQEEILHQQNYPREKKHLVGLIKRLPKCKIHAAYEAGPTGYQTLQWLRELGCEAFMTPPSLIPVQLGERVKTDRRSSQKLAELLRVGMLKSVHDLKPDEYENRELVRTREQLIEHRSDISRQIKSKLLFHGIEKPKDLGEDWSNMYLVWLENGPSGKKTLDKSIGSLIQIYKDIQNQVRNLDEEIRALAKTKEYVDSFNILHSTKGVGVLTAMTILLEIPRMAERFVDECELGKYVGLVPWEKSTGETICKGGITRTGNRHVRRILVEASWTVIRYDKNLGAVYERISKSRPKAGGKVAIVAVARRLLIRMRAMLRDKELDRGSTRKRQGKYGKEEAA
jgi:transposase